MANNERPRTGPWANANRWGTKAFLVGFVICVLAVPAHLVWDALHQAPAPTAAAPGATGDAVSSDTVLASGAAADFVTLWLSASSADEAAVKARLAFAPDAITLPATRPADPVTVSVARVVPSIDGHYTVDVIARRGTAATGWAVDVVVAGGVATVQTLPGSIAVPDVASRPVGVLEQLTDRHPAAQTLQGFMQAYLAGVGEVERYSSPGSNLGAVSPALCAATRTATATPAAIANQPGSGEVANVVVTVTCDPGRADNRTVVYGVQLKGRDGRWEVAGFVPASQILAATTDQAPPSGSVPPGSTRPSTTPSSPRPPVTSPGSPQSSPGQ